MPGGLSASEFCARLGRCGDERDRGSIFCGVLPVFRYEARGEGRKLSPALEVSIGGIPSKTPSRRGREMAKLRLLPESYLFGLSDVLGQVGGYHSFLVRQELSDGPLVLLPGCMLIKSTLTFLFSSGRWYGRSPRGDSISGGKFCI